MDYSIPIRPECLRPATSGWEAPTGPEIREVIQRAGLTQSEAAGLLGVSVQTTGGSRQIRKWIAEEHRIPYPAWALLCHVAGLGVIWIDETN
jgi:transcriptional regulator with XRE-family HTH domain